eukprot:CCRYP_015264-RB/>CCRYP_015264-RB protein AED:0.34 eAED:0.34 QI:0/0.6/0.5/1/0.2/0.16/6/1601/147
MQRRNELTIGIGKDGRNSVAYAVRMAEMYLRIGRVEETVQLVEETLNVWRKGSGNKTTVFGPRDENEEVECGFTKSDVESMEPEELELIIQLLKIKGRRKLHCTDTRWVRQYLRALSCIGQIEGSQPRDFTMRLKFNRSILPEPWQI